MKSSAIVQTGKRKYEQQEFEVPEIGPEEGLLRIEQSGICGSDWSQYKQGFPFPVIPGNEPVGVLEQVSRPCCRAASVHLACAGNTTSAEHRAR